MSSTYYTGTWTLHMHYGTLKITYTWYCTDTITSTAVDVQFKINNKTSIYFTIPFFYNFLYTVHRCTKYTNFFFFLEKNRVVFAFYPVPAGCTRVQCTILLCVHVMHM